ncbi:uncharacterized protein BXZ73DRAFT_74129 [Epithele typhae]|uniref:uncharacterized protein n=1 Tax=Epithele typhae TaxID=378194 RepID=UPI0020089043|nr:uncharacterized protein BXZ73DRAFT_74129 [Epithele typhae]KAH9943086.1 hypothetical protein BXZ73DRAFT_74129 [Epithele typhae]
MSSIAASTLRSSLRRGAPRARLSSTQIPPLSASTSDAAPSSSPSSDPAPEPAELMPQLVPKVDFTLPDDKMRVLVDLYHDSRTWITRENLSSRIDAAFIHSRRDNPDLTRSPERPLITLAHDLTRMQRQPKFAPPYEDKGNKSAAATAWSERRSPREEAVLRALYGTHSRGRPTFEALVDEYEGMKKEVEEEKAAPGA